MMKALVMTICVLWAASCGAPLHAMSESIDGTWVATSDAMGSTLTLVLTSQRTSVAGKGTYTVGAMRTGTLTVTGTYQRRSADLSLKYDHGEVVRLRATSTDDEHMAGTLTDKNGSAMAVKFSRP